MEVCNMTDVYIIDPYTLMTIGIIDNYQSIIWRPSYSEIGDFEIYAAATPELIGQLYYRESTTYVFNWLVRSCDISEDGNIYKNVMMIKSVKLNTDVENGDHLTITGCELKGVLNQRIVWDTYDKSTNVDLYLHGLVSDNCITHRHEGRLIPNLKLDVAEVFPEKIDKQITFDQLGDAVTDICITHNIGWEIYIDKSTFNMENGDFGSMYFRVYKGVDRSYGQTERPYVVFSDEFENLYNTEYQLSVEGCANHTLIGGEGEGNARAFTSYGNEYYFSRFEVFTDAKDITSSVENADGTTTKLTSAQYTERLREKGKENVVARSYTESFVCEVISDVTFKYKEDFYLGDIVTVINKYGIAQNIRVTSAIESEDENGVKLVPQFNI